MPLELNQVHFNYIKYNLVSYPIVSLTALTAIKKLLITNDVSTTPIYIVLLWHIIYWTYTVKDSSSVNAIALDVLVLLLYSSTQTGIVGMCI